MVALFDISDCIIYIQYRSYFQVSALLGFVLNVMEIVLLAITAVIGEHIP